MLPDLRLHHFYGTGSILDRAHIAGARLEVWRLSDEPKREFTVLIHLPNGRTMQCFSSMEDLLDACED
jgi:hypothetical protein